MEGRRLTAATGIPNYVGDMRLELAVALTRAALEALTVGHVNHAATGGDQLILLKLLEDGIDRGALHAKQLC